MRALFLVALLASSSALAQFRTLNKNRDWLTWNGLTAALSSFAASSGNLPQATHLCAVGVATGASQWECTTMAVTQPSSPSVEGTWLYPSFTSTQRSAIRVTGAASSPTVAAATAAAVGLDSLLTGDHTFMVTGFAASGATRTYLSHGLAGTDGVLVRFQSGVFRCSWSGVTDLSNTLDPGGEWVVGFCSKSGTTYKSWANGTATTTTSASNPTAPTTRNVEFGISTSGSLSGSLGVVAFWPRALTDAEMSLMAAKWWGFWGSGSSGDFAGTTTRATSRGCMGDDGFFYMLGDNAPCVTSKGVDSSQAVTNLGINSLDASAWTNVGTSTVSSNVASGPFSRYAGGPEVDEIVDDDPTNSEGRAFANFATTTTGDYAAVCHVGPGATGTTTDTGRFEVVATGGTVTLTSCSTFSGMTSIAARTCLFSVSGAVTNLATRLVVGANSTATGSIRVSYCDLVKASFAGPPLPCGGVACTANADVHTIPTTGWPTTSGEVEFAYTPSSDTGTRYLLDTRPVGAAFGPGIVVWVTGNLNASTRNGASNTDASVAMSWTAGTTYCIKYVWGAGGSSLYRSTGSWSSGALTCGAYGAAAATAAGTNLPTSHATSAFLASSNASVSQANGPVKLLYVGAPR